MPLPLLLTFRHWAGVSPYTSPYGFAETCVFVKQSVEPLRCEFHTLQITPDAQNPSFSRSYGCILPSSLTEVLPIALHFSCRPPVSVCGTDILGSTLRSFSRQRELTDLRPLRDRLHLDSTGGFAYRSRHLGASHLPCPIGRLGYPSASLLRSSQTVSEC